MIEGKARGLQPGYMLLPKSIQSSNHQWKLQTSCILYLFCRVFESSGLKMNQYFTLYATGRCADQCTGIYFVQKKSIGRGCPWKNIDYALLQPCMKQNWIYSMSTGRTYKENKIKQGVYLKDAWSRQKASTCAGNWLHVSWQRQIYTVLLIEVF